MDSVGAPVWANAHLSDEARADGCVAVAVAHLERLSAALEKTPHALCCVEAAGIVRHCRGDADLLARFRLARSSPSSARRARTSPRRS